MTYDMFNSLTPTVAIWVQLRMYESILCQTGLSRHNF